MICNPQSPSIREIKGSQAEEIINLWKYGNGSLSYEQWNMLEADIFVPDYLGTQRMIDVISLLGCCDEEQRVCGADRAIAIILENKPYLEPLGDHLIKILSTASEQKFLFTIAD